MGLFNHKQNQKLTTPSSSDDPAQEQFFDDYFKEELRNHGRWYFEKVLTENGAQFKQDLDDTITQVKTELDEHVTHQVDEAVGQIDEYLKAHVTRKLDEQFARYNDAVKTAQETALTQVTESTRKLQEQHQQLAESLQKSVEEQSSLLHHAFDENKADLTTMKETQAHVLDELKQSAADVEAQYQTLTTTLQDTVTKQKTMLIESFEHNMATVIEHYVLEALGEQFDLKAQLPSIVAQMETNKQAMADDIKL